MRKIQFTQYQAFFLLVGILALVTITLGWLDNGYYNTIAKLLLLNMILAVSLTVSNGLTGIFSLGHPAFMTLSAYIAVMFTYPIARRSFAMPGLPEFMAIELPFWLAACIGAFAAGLLAYLIGKLVLKLKSHYLALATLGLILVVQNLAINLDSITRGGRGLTGIPKGVPLWLIAILVLFVVVISWRIKHASTGRAMLAVRENELAARCFGIRADKMKLLAFVFGAVVAGYVGALLPHIIGIMTPSSFGLVLVFNLVVVVVAGGQGSIIGAILVSIIVGLGMEFLRPVEETFGLYGGTQVFIAASLIVLLIWRPKGLFGLKEPLVRVEENA